VIPFQLQRLDHVSLNVSDRARSIAWYTDVLGLELKNKPRADDWPAFMGDFGTCIGLFQEEPRFRHVAFALGGEDFARAQAHLADQGVDFQLEDHGNSHSLYLRDPDGHTVELTTYELG
jgi:catechol 2,3-dioxygenase-like lactoylglutathione lyase family enzyme